MSKIYPGMSAVEQMVREERIRPRYTRSAEYEAGVRAALEYRVNRARIHCPYDVATAQTDAFIAGCDEGHAIWRDNSANATLMAAAPDLLAALQAIVDLDDGDEPELWGYHDEFDAAREAIAKAIS